MTVLRASTVVHDPSGRAVLLTAGTRPPSWAELPPALLVGGGPATPAAPLAVEADSSADAYLGLSAHELRRIIEQRNEDRDPQDRIPLAGTKPTLREALAADDRRG